MAVALKEDYQRALDEQKNEVRELVMAGLEQIKEGKTKDFNTVCDRLEKKYRDEAISNQNYGAGRGRFGNAGDYIAYELKNPSAAENTVSGIRAKINSLVNFPERNELDEDELLAGLGVRKDYYRNYKIYYVIEEDTIYIVRILHMLVDSKAWLYRTFGL